eukprot:CAMPEP_0174302216 /NCGR_PEP_ID=MMETSP0809-20121228/59504_1 /TAXON_ID=73025 ORGANISM="Eutreptiella gymnastica-like, Strain CCMP1594" /NCGR_SAMPLE_ID=MMETSP0809 /ASSEMBLY_ACC=CAM_ASM_000658 /LENGTH=80 /DNA_ID=CAMNT_0015408097 /DNA_START=841 /DNA_END=1083 /DNA_ORIENTATION=+
MYPCAFIQTAPEPELNVPCPLCVKEVRQKYGLAPLVKVAILSCPPFTRQKAMLCSTTLCCSAGDEDEEQHHRDGAPARLV